MVMDHQGDHRERTFAVVPPVFPRPQTDLAPLLDWLRTGRTAPQRLDFPGGSLLPDGRLDLCKQALGPDGAALVVDALRPGPVRHLLLGTNGLGDGAGAVSVKAVKSGVETLYLGCKNSPALRPWMNAPRRSRLVVRTMCGSVLSRMDIRSAVAASSTQLLPPPPQNDDICHMCSDTN